MSARSRARPDRASRVAQRTRAVSIQALREAVCEANSELLRRGLAHFTFGNASAIDREQGLVVIKPSGVPYEELRPALMVVTDLRGKVLEGALNPSSDLATHLELYRAFGEIDGIAHTHSLFATAFAQARREIPCLGTTHADYFHGTIPITRPLTRAQVAGDYERHTGVAIVRRFKDIDPLAMPAVLVANHASFCWGASVAAAVDNASYLEEVATMTYCTLLIDPKAAAISRALLDRHFLRKHGSDATYGQRS